jgi:hypothetical protein
MPKDKGFKYGLAAVVGLGLIAGVVTTTSVRSQQGQPQPLRANVLRKGHPTGNGKDSRPSGKELDDAATPVVDFASPAPAAEGARKLKGARYDRYGAVVGEPDPRMGELISYSHWQVGLSDLPADKSDLVVEAKVTDSQAFLSGDKTGVYSEFTVRVSRVLKAADGASAAEGDTLVAERVGGRVRYPSGKIVRYTVSGQGSPMKGKKYLLFLSRGEQGNYKLLTGYELQGNQVFALDGSRTNRRGLGRWAFDKHNGEEAKSFWEAVERAINNPVGG